MSPGETADEYFRAIEQEFVSRRGAAMLLSPRDWALIGEWKEAGVPLHVVLQGIHNVFDSFEQRAPAGRRINSLSYCRQEVLGLHEIYRTLHAVEAGRPAPGAADAAGAAAMARHVGRLHRRVRLSMAVASLAGRDLLVGGLARIAAELKRLRREIKEGAFDPTGLEEGLRSVPPCLIVGGARDTMESPHGEPGRSKGSRAVDRDAPGVLIGTRIASVRRGVRRGDRPGAAAPR